jgi:DNA recombination protein RmuC
LTEGREYISQGRGLGLRNDAGGVQKPDIIIVLPEQRTMIIDSKVPLTGYERLIAASEESERAAAGTRFLRDVKAHIDHLAGKRYPDHGNPLARCALMPCRSSGAHRTALSASSHLRGIAGWCWSGLRHC